MNAEEKKKISQSKAFQISLCTYILFVVCKRMVLAEFAFHLSYAWKQPKNTSDYISEQAP